MGWTSWYEGRITTKRVKEILRREMQPHEVIDMSNYGATYYLACRSAVDGSIFAMVFLTSRQDGEFAYKAMHECEHPYRYKCPKRILDKLSPTDNDHANAWRKECALHRAKKNVKLPYGTEIEFKKPVEFVDGEKLSKFRKVKMGGKRNIFYSLEQGGYYRISGWENMEYTIL